MRDLKFMSESILGKKERLLLKLQRKNMIELESSSTDSDNYAYDTVKLLNSDNNFVKLGQIIKINKVLKQFKGKKLDKKDSNLIKGIFKRRPEKPYAEDSHLESEREKEIRKKKAETTLRETQMNLREPGPGRERETEIDEWGMSVISQKDFLSKSQIKTEATAISNTYFTFRKTNKVGIKNDEEW
jgi:hypothetical protein